MSKKGKTNQEWRKILRLHAQGKHKFGTGEKPRPNTYGAAELKKLEECPLFKNPSGRDLMGNQLKCSCSYHGITHMGPPVKTSRPSKPAMEQPSTTGQAQHASSPAKTSHTKSPPTDLSVVHRPSSSDLDAGEGCSKFLDTSSALDTFMDDSTNLQQDIEYTVSPPKSTQLSLEPVTTPVPSGATADTPGPSSETSQSVPKLQKKNQTLVYSDRLPVGWKSNMSDADRSWVGKELFTAKSKLTSNLKLWWYPPTTKKDKILPEDYFLKKLFLWMPREMWGVDFKCTRCTGRSLAKKGMYNRVRLVCGMVDYYYIATEYLECGHCHSTYIAWDQRMLEQLTDDRRSLFPAVLTRKCAMDNTIVSMLRSRNLGNSSTAIRNKVKELHSEEWMKRQLRYLADCDRQKKAFARLNQVQQEYAKPPPFPVFPSAKWFMAVYTRDVWSRLPSLKAAATSVYGSILKIDSTKKITKKLQGEAAGSATWATNVGNERGEVLVSVLTDSEGNEGLERMAHGLMERYKKGDELPPKVIYTDRDCCSMHGDSKIKALFSDWKDVCVRLDIWHFMRRIATGVSSESHPLYGVFMSKLSSCIFEWDEEDYERLVDAKVEEMKTTYSTSYSDLHVAARKSISLQEMARHCRRRTRGTLRTTEEIESLLLSMSRATDSLGVPLLREEMDEIWREQKRHVHCIQDPDDVALYTVTHYSYKGRVRLPNYRTARGSTSLESFHLHLARFIPGTSASAVHYQAYLLDGLVRWNASRAEAAIEKEKKESALPLSFDLQLQHKVNTLSESLFGTKLLPLYQPPSKYTGELFGAEYLYAQTGRTMTPSDLDNDVEKGLDHLDGEEDEGFQDGTIVAPTGEEDAKTFTLPSDQESEDDDDEQDNDDNEKDDEDDDDDASDSRGIGGWNKVDKLARALLDLQGLAITNESAKTIIECYNNLDSYDKRPLVFKQVAKKPPRGRFGRVRRNKSLHVGLTAMRKCFLSGGSPAASPQKSRVVEAIFIYLCQRFRGSLKRGTGRKSVSRWDRILSEYSSLRARILNSARVLEGTNLALYPVNKTTLIKWHQNKARQDEIKTRLQGIDLPPTITVTSDPLPPAKRLLTSPQGDPEQPHEFPSPEDTSGQAKKRRKGQEAPLAPSGVVGGASSTDGSSSMAVDLPTVVPPPVDRPSSSKTTSPKVVSRTTEWRRRNKAATVEPPSEEPSNATQLKKPSNSERKAYSCTGCGKHTSSEGHVTFKRRRYCPKRDKDIPLEEWLEKVKEEARIKDAAKEGAQNP